MQAGGVLEGALLGWGGWDGFGRLRAHGFGGDAVAAFGGDRPVCALALQLALLFQLAPGALDDAVPGVAP